MSNLEASEGSLAPTRGEFKGLYRPIGVTAAVVALLLLGVIIVYASLMCRVFRHRIAVHDLYMERAQDVSNEELLENAQLSVFGIDITSPQRVRPIDTMDTLVIGQLYQLSFVFILGCGTLMLGFLLTWFGVEASYRVKLGGHSSNVGPFAQLESGSPGLLFALLGVALIWIGVSKDPKFEEHTRTLPAGFVPVEETGEDEGSFNEEPIPDDATPKQSS